MLDRVESYGLPGPEAGGLELKAFRLPENEAGGQLLRAFEYGVLKLEHSSGCC